MSVEGEERRLLTDRWQRARFYAVRRAPYYAPYILKLRPVFTPGTGRITVKEDWTCRVDPALMDSDGDLWKLQLLWAHHLYHRHLMRREDRDPGVWSMACRLSTVDAWSTVMKREDTIADYPGEGWPDGVITPEELGLNGGLSPEQYYEQLYQPMTGGGGGGGQATEGEGQPQQGEGKAQRPSGQNQDPSASQQGGTSPKSNTSKSDDASGGGGNGGQDSEGQGSKGDQTAGGPEKSDSDSAADPSEDEQGSADQDKTPATKNGMPGPSLPGPGPIDLEGSEHPDSGEDLEMLEDVVRQKAKTEGGLNPGTLPGDLERELTPAPPYQVPVEQALQRLVGRSKGKTDWALTGRPSIRAMNRDDGAVPATLSRGLPEVVFLVDTSGSMDSEMLSAALSVGERVCRATTTQLAAGDTLIQRLDRREITPGALRNLKSLPGGGGTDMAGCVRQIARQARGKAVVVFTDGYFSWPESRAECGGADVIWVVLEHPNYSPEIPKWVEKSVLRVQRGDLRLGGQTV